MRGTKRDLLNLREVFVHRAIEHHLADDLERHQLLGPHLRGVKDVEVEIMFARLRYNLNSKLPLWICAVRDCLLKILAVEVL